MTAKRESDLLITSMITDWIGRNNVPLPINQNYDKIQETNKASIERWTILKHYECWKTLQFTQQSAPQRRTKNGMYHPITSMTCATVNCQLSKVGGQRLASSRLFWPATGPYWQHWLPVNYAVWKWWCCTYPHHKANQWISIFHAYFRCHWANHWSRYHRKDLFLPPAKDE